ncbi:dynein heavy chain domain-containing protein 1-like isoform X7 [Corythoichthys intestinalis]|uniref:dynein heavy chain domain-containing protein 1-like isoform X7 n=1 Tax=Corythoichthys intestinalis TaxID=161448 RepID=UPI0025A5B258|nr:dynein heavy chain domain-containing protein 1-like isoform X7 [Corythoichthys intestinalis]
MESLRQSTGCGKSNAKPKKKQSAAVSNRQTTLPPLWPEPFSHSASTLRRSLFNPSAVVAVPMSSATPQAEPLRVLTGSKLTGKPLSGTSVSCKEHSDDKAKSLAAKDESKVTVRDIFSLPAIIPSVATDDPCSTLREQSLDPKWTEKNLTNDSASCADITDKIVDKALQSLPEKEAARIMRRDLFNFPAIVPGSPRLANSQKAMADIGRREWSEKPRQTAFASCTDITAAVTDEASIRSFTDESITTGKIKRLNQVEKVPTTGMEIVQLFLKNKDVGELQVFYLKEQEGASYRPYDLRVVPTSEAGSEHYVFTPKTVLHVTQKGSGDLVSVEKWFRESVLWTALQAIPFFGKFILRNATTLWYRNMREIVYKRRFEKVQAHLLTNIPQYRNGLLLLSRAMRELEVTHLLPLDVSKTYTLLEFQNALETSMQNALNRLRQFSQFRIDILNKAKEEGYKNLKELQEHFSYAELPHHCCKPMHLHQAHLNELQKDLAHAKNILQKLGNFAALVNYIIMQNLVTVVQKSVTLFLNDFLKRDNSLGWCLFQTDMSLGAGQLTLVPPFHHFQETISRALLTAGDSIGQICDTCGFFLEVSKTIDCQDKTSDLNCGPYPVVVDSRGDLKDNNEMPHLADYSCCRWIREQRPGWELMMTMQGHTMPCSYYPLSKEQLMWYITINDITISINKEQTELMQATESEIQQLLENYTWVLDVHVFISQWSPASLENLKGQPALLYEELIKKLRQWLERIHAAPSSMSTSNQLFIIHCTHVKEYIEQQLNLIENEVQEELVNQMKVLSASFLHDLEEALTTLRIEPKDLHDLPKFVDTVWNSVNIFAGMHKRLEYVHTLQDSICTFFRAMTTQELSLGKKMLDMWDCFYLHLKHAASSLHSRLPAVATALYAMFPLISSDLRSIVENYTSGPFLDPRQNAEQLASELKYSRLRVETASANLEQLARIGEIFPENPVDLTDLNDVPKLNARKELWELIAHYRRCSNEWNTFLFTELPLSQAQEQINLWQQQVANISRIVPAGDSVIQEISESINDLSYRLKLLARFKTRTIKPKHRRTFFKGIGLWDASDKNATLAQIVYHPFDLHQELMNKLCEDAQKENSMEQAFRIIQQAWRNRIFQLHNYTSPYASWDAEIITGLEFLFSEIEKDVMTMTYMHRSRHSVDFRMEVEEWIHLLQELGRPGNNSNIREQLFLLAYIWGFGGHLHPRLWPQFDKVARQVLTDSRSQIVIPREGTVFEFFFDIDNKIYSENTLLTKSITPKYWKYTCLLKVMLEAIQPVLLAGEPGSGKSSVCNTLLCFDKPHIKVPASSIRGPEDLRHLLCGISCQMSCQKTKGIMKKQPGLMLYVDDLHETPSDVTGKSSKILETLRQSISKGGILAIDSDHFKVLSPGTITYLATCCVFELDNPHISIISSRLSRLFSIFALPSLTTELIFSIYSPKLKLWLRDVPFIPRAADMVRSIINATEDVYKDVCNHFQPTKQSPCFMFSHRDLKKVFQGMCLWQPILPKSWTLEPKAKSKCFPVPQKLLFMELNIVHLWIHECMRAFGDRMSSVNEITQLQSLISKTATAHFSLKMRNESNLGALVSQLGPAHTRKPRSPARKFKQTALTDTNFPNLQENFLQYLQEVVTKFTYGPEIAGNDFPRFKNRSYHPQDLNVLGQHLLAHFNTKNNEKQSIDSHFAFKYTVHRQRMCQMLRIFRALLIPGGHGLLMASGNGTGRKTNVRLAAYLSGSDLIEVHAGNESKLHTILKKAGNQTRVYAVNTIILVHENISSSVREELLVALMSYPGLYTDQELAKIVSRVTAVYKTRRFLLDSWIFDKYLCQNLRDVHVFVLMPAIASTSSGNDKCKAQIVKALGLCCVETYQPWFSQSLTEVAAYYLKQIYRKLKMQDSHIGLAGAMAGVHQSAYQYASVLLTTQPFSPYTYMAFISHFAYLCKLMLNELESRVNRLNTCLSHLDALDNIAMEERQELMRMQRIVDEKQACVNVFREAIDEQKRLLEKAKRKLAKKERMIQLLEDRIAESEDELSPYFKAAFDAIHYLDPLDLAEVGHYRDPPDGVVLVMNAVLLLFDRPFGWENAKLLFLQCNLYKCLETFDFYSLPDKDLIRLAEIVKNPIFLPELIRDVSNACESLCRWLLAIHNCGTVCYQLMVRKQLDLMLLRMKAQLEEIKEYIKEIYIRLEELRAQQKPMQELLEEQLLQLHEDECQERKAGRSVELLLKHSRMWRACTQDLQIQRECLPADAMVLAGIISYLGAFASDVRNELLSKWKSLCQTGHIDPNPKDPRSSLFATSDPESPQPPAGFPVAVSDELQPVLRRVLGVKEWPDNEPATTRLLVKLLLWGCTRSWVKYWPLLADTQHHLEINLNSGIITGETGNDHTLGKEFKCDLVMCADDPKLICQLELAAEKGLKVLVTHIERVSVTPQFLAILARPAASCPLGSKQTAQQTHPEFFLLLSTHYPARLLSSAIHPSVLAQVDVIDLSPSSDQIQELMLTQLLQSECKVLLIQHLRMENDKQVIQKKLVVEEDCIMDFILQSDTTRMQDTEFLTEVTEIKESMAYSQTELQLVDEIQEYHKHLLAAPEQLIKLAWLFYQALQEVSRLSPAYYFSLSNFNAIMQEVFTDKAGRLISYGTGAVIRGLIPELRNRMVSKLMFYYRPFLFRGHCAVLRQLLTLAVMQTKQLCSPPERTAFLLGFNDILAPQAPNQVVPDLCLETIPAFRGLNASLSASRKEWQEYLSLPFSVIAGPVPSEAHSDLSLIQRALLFKTLRPFSTEQLANAMAASQFRQPGHTSIPHCGNPRALYRFFEENKGPIILTWACPSKDKWISIQPLHLIKLLAFKADAMPVRVISVGGLSNIDIIMVALENAVKDGHWLVFNNCHLLEKWDAKLVARFNQLFSPFGATKHWNTPHSDFRLWFLTEETTQSFLPAIVRMHALAVVCDSSWNIKEELSCSLQYLSFIAKRGSENLSDNTELLLRCATFHSVVLQREAYKCTGQPKINSWSQSDLLALVDALISSASLCHDKTKALQYIAGNLIHGSHTVESTDCEVVQNTAETCFCTAPPVASGPHILANIISSTEHRDLAKLPRLLVYQLLYSINISEPLLLGFSADMEAEIVKINSHNLNKMLQASQVPPSQAVHSSSALAMLPELSQARERLHELQEYLTHQNEIRSRNAGAVFQSPLYDFLLTEWQELNGSVSSLLCLLQQPHRYLTETFLSLPTLTALSRLQRRAELLSAYLWRDNDSATRATYRLSAFANAKGLLVALMRKAAQTHHKYLSDIVLHLGVRDDPLFTPPPKDAVYLCDLDLKGASWNAERAVLENTLSPQPFAMPLICVRAHVKDAPLQHSRMPDQVYHCPIYVEDMDTGEDNRNDLCLITTVPFASELEPSLCSLRKVRLVSRLSATSEE